MLGLRHTDLRKAVLAEGRGGRIWCKHVGQPVLMLGCLLKVILCLY